MRTVHDSDIILMVKMTMMILRMSLLVSMVLRKVCNKNDQQFFVGPKYSANLWDFTKNRSTHPPTKQITPLKLSSLQIKSFGFRILAKH